MESFERKIEVYVTEEGKAPFTEWLDALRDLRGRETIRARLNRIRLGNFGDSSSVGEGVEELRIDFGPGYRVYFGQARTKVVLLLCGGDKSTQTQDILQAKRYWKDHQERSGRASK
ncbi:MAG: type II toxin-antitoxin system RelE/ParE family toxin [Nitrospirae bacterium]|nr:MAG: type II toxin-antitoxin system RelE/ParE family toxin [Nitrospirota bacterium]